MTRSSKAFRVESNGVAVRVYQDGAHWWADVRSAGRRTRVSLRTTDKAVAKRNAGALATEIATRQLLGVSPSTLTLGQLFSAYFEHKGATLEGQWRRQADAHRRDFEAIWGAAMKVVAISQTSVDAYCRARRQAWTLKRDGATMRDGALDNDFRWLSSVMNWAVKHKLETGKRLLDANPLGDCAWPREKVVRRPVATDEAFRRTMAKVDDVDPAGRLRLILAISRYSGHCISAILGLWVTDLLRTPAAVESAAPEVGLGRDRLWLVDPSRPAQPAQFMMPHGAIRWRAENDKQGIAHITPCSPELRAEIDRYCATILRIGDVPLFPAPRNAGGAVDRGTATKWLVKAEALAELPKTVGGIWHPYRRLWATERKHLPDVDVATAGGWNGTKAMKLCYQQSTAQGVLQAVLNSA